jgi:hypothetical protein
MYLSGFSHVLVTVLEIYRSIIMVKFDIPTLNSLRTFRNCFVSIEIEIRRVLILIIANKLHFCKFIILVQTMKLT